MLVLPWMFKFLWSPLIDAVRTPRWTRRSWILTAQLLMGGSLIPLLAWDIGANLSWMVPLLLIHACAAATQDAAIDALAIASVPRAEQGSLNGWMQVGMLTGRSALGGGALLLEEQIGTRLVILLLIGVIWSSSFLLLFSRDTGISFHLIRGRFFGPAPTHWSEARVRVAKSRDLVGTVICRVGRCRVRSGWRRRWSIPDRPGFPAVGIGRFFRAQFRTGMEPQAPSPEGYLADRLGKRAAVSVSSRPDGRMHTGLAAYDAMSGANARTLLIPAMTLLYVCIGLFTARPTHSSWRLPIRRLGRRSSAPSWVQRMPVNPGPPLRWVRPSRLGYPAAFPIMCAVSIASLPLVRYLVAAPTDHPRGLMRRFDSSVKLLGSESEVMHLARHKVRRRDPRILHSV